MERSVIDTNVLLSAMLFPGSLPALCLSLAQRSGVVLASPATLAELIEVMHRPKFLGRLTDAVRNDALRTFRTSIELVSITHQVQACRDPKDDKFLEVALEGGASILISGDKDLLALHPWCEVRIVSPAEYLAARHEPQV